jgi:hypothetical protein
MNKLRLVFLVTEQDDWALAAKRLETKLGSWLAGSGITYVGIETVGLSDAMNSGWSESGETICVFYHASCEESANFAEISAPDYVCFLRISGGTFESLPAPEANAKRHYHFTCPTLDMASWMRWLEKWEAMGQFAPSKFTVACGVLQRSSDLILELEELKDALIDAVQKERHETRERPFSEHVASVRPLMYCLERFQKVRRTLENSGGEGELIVAGAFYRAEATLDSWIIAKDPESRSNALIQLEAALDSFAAAEISYVEPQRMYDEYREMKHVVNSTFSVLMALAELGMRNPGFFGKLSYSTIERLPEELRLLQKFQETIDRYEGALSEEWQERRQVMENHFAVLSALSELSQRNPVHYEKLAAATLERCPDMIRSLQDYADRLRAALFDNGSARRIY